MKIDIHKSSASQLLVNFGANSNAGSKKLNEDAFGMYSPVSKQEQALKGSFFCVADGISGSSVSGLASRVACQSVAIDYYSTPEFWSVKKSARSTISAINTWLYSQGNEPPPEEKYLLKEALVTTFSCLIIKSNTAHIFHVGDSRVYRLRGKELELITSDHNYAYQPGTTYLNRALGLENKIDIDYTQCQLNVGDRFVITTDGVHEHVNQKQFKTLLSTNRDESADLNKLAELLVDTALQKGTDNATSVVVDVYSLPPVELHEAYDTLSLKSIPPVLSKGDVIDGFSIVRPLADDARSKVYLAKRLHDGMKCVLKAPAKQFKGDSQYLQGFILERWVLSRMNNPFILKAYPTPNSSEYFYHVTEYLKGQTLREWMDEQGRASKTDVQKILSAMIKPVRYLHRNNITHRDLKPENFIFNSREFSLKLIDFGTVELGSLKDDLIQTQNDEPVGDIGYLAPEYLVKGVGSTQSDLFSIASIVYELITGELPYSAILSAEDYPRQYEDWRYRSIFAGRQTLNGHYPTWLDPVMRKALSPKSEARFELLSEFEKEFTSPSSEMKRKAPAVPLLERNPTHFYQIVIIFLIAIIIAQTMLIASIL